MEKSLKTRAIVSAIYFTLLLGAPPTGWCGEAGAPFYYRRAESRMHEVRECEVAVYGGTPAGVTAAIEAASMGRTTLLLSFNGHVGGMTSGGLTATDLGKKES